MDLIISILVGAVAGWLADRLFNRFSFSIWLQIGWGIVGGFVGGGFWAMICNRCWVFPF